MQITIVQLPMRGPGINDCRICTMWWVMSHMGHGSWVNGAMGHMGHGSQCMTHCQPCNAILIRHVHY
jgi:hypothetical protein